MKKNHRLALCQFFLAFFATHANAAITLDIVGTAVNPASQATMDGLAANLEDQFNTVFAGTNSSGFLTEMGNANIGSTRSILAPGTQENIRYEAAFSVNAAFSGGTSFSTSVNSIPSVGVGVQGGLTLSASGELIKLFRGLDPKRVLYHFSYFSKDFSSYLASSGVSMDSMQFSTGISYQLFRTESWLPGVRFNGIRVASGISYGNFNASYTTPFTYSSGGIDMRSDVTLAVDSKVYTLSSEAVTGIRAFYILDLYTGLGVDFNFGSTSLKGSSGGGTVSAVSGSSVVYSGTATVSGTADTSSPSIVQLRYLLGTQLNLGPLGLFLQGQISTPTVMCLNFGAKLMF
jgi:hypothetical protein